ncbi:cupin domain-containing protein [Aquimonas voraii]|uniref:Mannose-6-phosphate isomerase, cupin superfamily n=1 Tax=Aquimonas voraii TaxID=265719 RepID=A0A1G6SJZ6_9GAMM|nr:cupin domain-containing protein [Aquimonas voraii]SDD16466.1 Mannose-6-phosphate isomerase, cupin superfamily [Aquimonas voraii]
MSIARIHPQPPEEYWFVEGCHILEWHNRVDDPALSVARARVASGQTTRWHRLHGITERYLILSGRGRVEVEGLPPTELGAGAVVVIPPGVAQRIACVGEEALVFLAMCTPRFEAAAYEDVDATSSF